MVDPHSHWQHPPVSPTAVRCVVCGYDLSGAPVGGYCSECGTPVNDSLRPLQTEQHCSTATTSMILGILSLAVCGLLGPFAIGTAVSARKQMEHGGYSKGSRTMASAGFIMGTIATVLLGLAALIMVVGLLA